MARQSSARSDPGTTAETTGGASIVSTATVLAVLVTMAIVGAVAGTGLAAGAGSTGVELDPANASVDPGENATLDVVVTDAAGGVGAYNLTVGVTDPSVASIATVEPVGEPGVEEITRGTSGSVTVVAGLLNTNDTGPVTVARVVLAGATEGTTSVSVAVDEVGDDGGDPYTVTSIQNATVRVGDATPEAGSRVTASTTPGTDATRAMGTPRATDDGASTDATAETANALGDETTAGSTVGQPETPTASASSTGDTGMEGVTRRAATRTAPGTATISTASETPTTTSGSGPGFGVAVACGALLALGVGRLIESG